VLKVVCRGTVARWDLGLGRRKQVKGNFRSDDLVLSGSPLLGENLLGRWALEVDEWGNGPHARNIGLFGPFGLG
jgi:hypothetical protein